MLWRSLQKEIIWPYCASRVQLVREKSSVVTTVVLHYEYSRTAPHIPATMFKGSFDAELGKGASRLQKEQEKRKKEAKLRVEKEKRMKAAADKRQKEFEAKQQEALLQRMAERDLEEEKRLELERITGGISYCKQLKAVPVDGDGDKVVLPVSALEELNPQDALDIGPLTFQLTTPDGVKTHAGVSEFTAEEGTIGLPPKVALSLTKGRALSTLSMVQVRYVRLGKGTFATFQPQGGGFGAGRDDIDMKALLEKALGARHTTLTLGDWVPVRHEGATVVLVVRELRPEQQVTLIDTDVEAEFLPSEEAAPPRASGPASAGEAAHPPGSAPRPPRPPSRRRSTRTLRRSHPAGRGTTTTWPEAGRTAPRLLPQTKLMEGLGGTSSSPPSAPRYRRRGGSSRCSSRARGSRDSSSKASAV